MHLLISSNPYILDFFHSSKHSFIHSLISLLSIHPPQFHPFIWVSSGQSIYTIHFLVKLIIYNLSLPMSPWPKKQNITRYMKGLLCKCVQHLFQTHLDHLQCYMLALQPQAHWCTVRMFVASCKSSSPRSSHNVPNASFNVR